MKWELLREEEFEGAIEKSGGVCVIPFGCVEKHGQHLPVGCDTIAAKGVVELASQMEEVMIFPEAMWLGDVTGYHSLQGEEMIKENRNRGGIGLKLSTILTLMEELCDEIARNGFRKILIVNGHGGNVFLLNHFLRSLSYNLKSYAVMCTNYYYGYDPAKMYETVLERKDEFSYLTEEDMQALARIAKTGTGGAHADWEETAYMLALCPDAVAPDKYEAESGHSIHRSDYLTKEGISLTLSWTADFPNAYSGDPPHGCSENIGKAMMTLSAERMARIFKMLKEDEECIRIANRLPKLEV